MNTDTALGLLGPLASIAVQRRYIVGGTKDTYRTVGELLDDGDTSCATPSWARRNHLPASKRSPACYKHARRRFQSRM